MADFIKNAWKHWHIRALANRNGYPFCTYPDIAGDPYVPHNIQEHIEIPDDVFEEVKRRWLAGEPG